MKKVRRNTSFLISVVLHVLLIIFLPICMQSPKPKKDEAIEVVILGGENIPKPTRPPIKDRIQLNESSISPENRGQQPRRGDPNRIPIRTNIQGGFGKYSKPKGSSGEGNSPKLMGGARKAVAVESLKEENSDVPQNILRMDKPEDSDIPAGGHIRTDGPKEKVGMPDIGKGDGLGDEDPEGVPSGFGEWAKGHPEVLKSKEGELGELIADRIKGRKSVSILDTSGSMQGEPIKLARKALKGVAIKKLGEKDKFYVIAFNTQHYQYPPHGAPVDKQDNGWESFIDGWQAGGNTAMLKTLRYVLSSLNVDKIVLISDGFPTDGDERTILPEVRKYKGKVTIDTIAISFMEGGAHKGADLLRKIAEETGGKYIRFNVMDYSSQASP